MNAFLVQLDNRPGSLAELAGALAAGGVNIHAVAGAAIGGHGHFALATDDEPATRAALGAHGTDYSEVEISEVTMPHEPGSLALATRRLADAGINIDAILPLGMYGDQVTIGLVTSDPVTAKAILDGVWAPA